METMGYKGIYLRMRLEEIMRVEDIIHSMKDALVNVDREWRFIFANHNALQFLNRTEAELIGSSIWEAMPVLKDAAFEKELNRALQHREPVIFEAYMAENNTWLEIRAKSCGDGLSLFFSDITAHKTVGLALKQSEELFSKAFYSCPAALVISRIHDGLIIDTNESYELLIKYYKNELIGRDIRELHDSEDRKKMVRQVLKEGRVRNFKMNITNKLGKVINCVLSADLIRMGDVDCVITTLVDVTELNETQKALHYMNANLETMVRARTAELADALQREKEMNELKSQFVTMASHEFRTPLSTILSSASLIEKYTEPTQQEQRDKHVDRIKLAVKNLTDILNEFLSLEKLEQGKVEAKGEAFDLEEFTAKIAEGLSGILKEEQKIIYMHKGQRAVMLDKKMLHNILINLLSNAIKYSKKDITLETEIKGGQVNISVTDKGIGIPAEEQKHLFSMFFRAKNATNIQGTGLGLNIVKRYLDLMGGQISFKSELEEGTTFTVQLPL